jgi:hypothetical protein
MIGFRFVRAGAASAVLLALATQVAGAQNADSLRKRYLLQMPKTIEIAASAARSAPGSTAASPSAYGANFGDGFVGLSFQNRTRFHASSLPFRDRADGAVVAGFGLGNSRDAVGLEVAATSFSTLRSGFGSHDGFSFKLHRVLPKNVGVAVGWENAILINGAHNDGGQSIYGVVSTVLKSDHPDATWFSSLSLNAGVGGGRFQSEKDFQALKKGYNGFGSVGLRVFEPLSVIADYTGQDLVAGLSIVPFVRIPLVISPAFADLTRHAGDGPRFTLGVGMGFRFAQIRDILAPNH